MSDFSIRLREERKRLSLTQADMAAAGGVKPNAQVHYESGDRVPSADYLQRLEGAGIDVLYVLTGRRAAPSDLSPEQTALLASLDRADDAGRAAILAVASIASRGVSKSGNAVTIGGDVGQSIAGDASFAAPVSFAVGKKKSKPE